MAGVFDTAFADHGVEPVWLTDDAELLALIRRVKSGAGPDETGPLMQAQAEALLLQGADHLLIACTELSLLTGYVPKGVAWTDSLDWLTAAIVEFAQSTG